MKDIRYLMTSGLLKISVDEDGDQLNLDSWMSDGGGGWDKFRRPKASDVKNGKSMLNWMDDLNKFGMYKKSYSLTEMLGLGTFAGATGAAAGATFGGKDKKVKSALKGALVGGIAGVAALPATYGATEVFDRLVRRII